MPKTIFLIVGESGSGKDSLVAKACEELNLKQLKSYTTRPRRVGETDTHTFISPDEVEQYKNQMIAYTQIGDYIYFATKQQLYDVDAYVIDYLGIKWMYESSVDLSDFRFVTIFINTPKYIREQRALNSRNDDALTFYKRCFNEDIQFKEMLLKNDFDYAVSNVDFDKAYKIFKYIVETELNK